MSPLWYRTAWERLVRQTRRAACKPFRRPKHRPWLEELEARRAPAVFLVKNTNDGGADSLRQAILSATAQAGADTIAFNISGAGVRSIALASALPTITGAVLIDGTTQSGFTGTPLIELNGQNAGAGANGLTISAGNSTVVALVINRFGGDGIQLTTNGGNQIKGCLLGTDPTGTTASPNGNDGVEIIGSSNNTVGGTAAGTANVLSDNGRNGVTIVAFGGAAATGNRIQGNRIGTNAAGTAALANAAAGVNVNGAASNTVGGALAGTGNLISGNTGDGVLLSGTGAQANVVQGNQIGTNAVGTLALANGGSGVFISAVPNNTIGGAATGAGNLISANTGAGVLITGPAATGNRVQGNQIGTNAAGTAALANGTGLRIESASNTVGGAGGGAGNLISGNTGDAVFLTGGGATGNKIQGNRIGTNAAGAVALGNGLGVDIHSASNTVGGTAAGAGNIISGNTGDGILITGAGATGNLVQGNQIGTDATGTAPLGNGFRAGVEIQSASNTVGGTAAGAGNLISGNTQDGIGIVGSGATGNLVQGNQIGTDVSGALPLGNILGVEIDGAAANTLGGTTAGAGNLLSGNNIGVEIFDATGNLVQGNKVGTNASGSAPLGNSAGLFIVDGTSNTVGGTTPGAGNLFSGNTDQGVILDGDNNLLQGNRIGTDVTGTAPLDNGTGVLIEGAANTVGGTAAGAGNLISGNAKEGVLFLVSTTGSLLLGNRIGTDAAGTGALGNNIGVRILTSSNTVGGTTAGAGNLISGNTAAGVSFKLNLAAHNVLLGNQIGTDISGARPLGNAIGVDLDRAPSNTIGGTVAAAGNLISGNTGFGMFISGDSATGNVLLGNLIGTNAAGTAALGNHVGVEILSASNTVGGTAAEAVNLISGNAFAGVGILDSAAGGNLLLGNRIGTNAAGTAALGSSIGVDITRAASNTVGGAGAGNLISGNGTGVHILSDGSAGNQILCNQIGTNATGSAALGNGIGVQIEAGSGNAIGGTAFGTGNLISGNTSHGVLIGVPGVGSNATGNGIQGNKIGTNAVGTAALANGIGVEITGASNQVGNITAGFGNLISGNLQDGILLSTGTNFPSGGNLVLNNQIGTNADGTAKLANNTGIEIQSAGNGVGLNLISGNSSTGVRISGSGTQMAGNRIGTNAAGTAALGNQTGVAVQGASNSVGGTGSPGGNLISGNTGAGVLISGSGATGNLVQGNFIGTAINGTDKLSNGIGIELDGASNTVGGASGGGNLISNNDVAGIRIRGANNVVQGNSIGVTIAGNPAANGIGVQIVNAAGNTIGGAVGNTIASNHGAGVAVLGTAATGNLIRNNALFGNGGLGIDLGNDGVTKNDAGDGDSGPNRLQNFPTLTAASSNSTTNTTTVGGTLSSRPNATFTIDFYSSDQVDPSGFGEGKQLRVTITLSTGASGVASFTKTFTPALPVGSFLTATATDAVNDTSEFSQAKAIGPRLATGTDAGDPPLVKVYDGPTGQLQFSFLAYPESFRGGVRVAVGDVNGDGVPDIVTAPGPGAALPVQVFDADTGRLIDGPLGSFFPFGTDFRRGMFLAIGDFNGDHQDDVVVSEDAGGQPLVKIYSGASGGEIAQVHAFGHRFHGGVRIAAADVNGDGRDDLVAAAGPGDRPLVRVFDGTAPHHVIRQFLAYRPHFQGGVYIAAGDLDGDGKAEIITGMGAGGKPLVKVFDGANGRMVAHFKPYPANFRGGVRVGLIRDLNGDHRPEIIVGTGPGGHAHVRVFDGLTRQVLDDFFAYDDAFNGGVFVAGRR